MVKLSWINLKREKPSIANIICGFYWCILRKKSRKNGSAPNEEKKVDNELYHSRWLANRSITNVRAVMECGGQDHVDE